jgi:hypothetical protein
MNTIEDKTGFEFSKECDEILRNLDSWSYEEAIEAIDQVERRAKVGGVHEHEITVSCADLRLDAALITKQSLAECERRYDDLFDTEPGEDLLLLKACILVKESMPSGSVSALERLSRALKAAENKVAPPLLERARRLLAEPPVG